MQLILRQPAAGTATEESDGIVIAASPDTLGREVWLWDIRMRESEAGYEVVVERNAEVITVNDGSYAVADEIRLRRDVTELWVAVVLGSPIVHGSFRLGPGDVAIWEGDDPDEVVLRPEGAGADIRLIRISRRDGRPARWVP